MHAQIAMPPHAIASTKSGFGLQCHMGLIVTTISQCDRAQVKQLGSVSKRLQRLAVMPLHVCAVSSHLRMRMPSSIGDNARYFSVPSSARSPAPRSTGVVCVWNPADQQMKLHRQRMC
jgi:hypothetical protein